MSKDLSTTEELDFHYLLGLMPPLHKVPEFAWLPELFSIIGYDRLIMLCKYAGGEKIQIPTLDQLSTDVEALEWFYKVEIAKSASFIDIPVKLHGVYNKIAEIYHARQH